MSVVSISRPRTRARHQIPTRIRTDPPAATLQLTVAAGGADPVAALGQLLAHIAAVPDLAVITPTRAAEAPAASDTVDSTGHDDGTIRIHAHSRRVFVGGDEVTLCRLEYDLLAFLVENREQVFTRGQLLNSVWDDAFVGTRTVDVHVRRLRAKLGAGRALITTMRGIGYRLATDAPVVLITTSPVAGADTRARRTIRPATDTSIALSG
jgi:two-component system, OmpR family, response regulator MtrA